MRGAEERTEGAARVRLRTAARGIVIEAIIEKLYVRLLCKDSSLRNGDV